MGEAGVKAGVKGWEGAAGEEGAKVGGAGQVEGFGLGERRALVGQWGLCLHLQGFMLPRQSCPGLVCERDL